MVPGQGFAALYAVHPRAFTADRKALVADMARLARRPLSAHSARYQPAPITMAEMAPTRKRDEAPANMVRVPVARFRFKVSSLLIEGEDRAGVDVQYPWEEHGQRHHDHTLDVPAFFIDRHLVTNADFARFLTATGYRPRDPHNFLRRWGGKRRPPRKLAGKPVVWISRDEAMRYCRWAGKRLPHEWEWQYAAQGKDGRLYPWGDEWNPSAVPAVDRGRTMAPLVDVGKHPAGASPFGVQEMVGHVWQWTDAFADAHTRSAIVRGGSAYWPFGLHWYFPRSYRLDAHGKYLLMAESRDRSGAIGFRCVVDAAAP